MALLPGLVYGDGSILLQPFMNYRSVSNAYLTSIIIWVELKCTVHFADNRRFELTALIYTVSSWLYYTTSTRTVQYYWNSQVGLDKYALTERR